MEWKTSSKPKPNLAATYDAPIQAAAYVGALNLESDLLLPSAKKTIASPATKKDLNPTPSFTQSSSSTLPSSSLKIDNGALLRRARIVICYDDGTPATAHDLSPDLLDEYWKLWRERLVTYWMKTVTESRIAEALQAVERRKEK